MELGVAGKTGTDNDNVLRADVFRPDDGVPAPAIMTLGPMGKACPMRTTMLRNGTDSSLLLPSPTRSYMTWETVDSETWIPWGYICIRVD